MSSTELLRGLGRATMTLWALTTVACATTAWNGYPGGTVKSSQVEYDYVARPVLMDPAQRTYRISGEGPLATVSAVPSLESRGVRRVDSGGDVVFTLTAGAPQHEPGGMGMGSSYQPALVSKVSITIVARDGSGRELAKRPMLHEDLLTIRGAKSYPTREEARKAMASIANFIDAGADRRAYEGAARKVNKELELIGKSLFEPRAVKVKLPAIRSAGDVDLEGPYTRLAEAKGPEQVAAALEAYQAVNPEPKKLDGSPDVVGAYGIQCGVASAKVLVGDLSGAWQATKAAGELLPEGHEHKDIARVLYEQQQLSGVEIIPPEEIQQMTGAAALQKTLGDLFKQKR
jgi:hypothetical protein